VKLGLVTERIGTSLGGAERWTYDFARWLVAQRHDVHVVCRADRRCQIPEGAVMHELDCGRSPLVFATAAGKRLDELHCDVTHDMGGGWNCDVFQPHCGSRTAAVLRNLHRMSPAMRTVTAAVQPLLPRYRRFAALCARQYAGGRRMFVAVSRMVARDFEQFHGVDPRWTRVIHNGVDTERFSPVVRYRLRRQVRERLEIADQDVVLLLVAHNLRLKGLPALIHSAGQLRRCGAPVRLLVVGNGQTARYARDCRRLGLDIHFAGVVSDPLPYYAAADVYVHPTYYDPCSLVVLEAWACGLPVITSQFNGCAELMQVGFEQYVLPDPAHVPDLVKRLELLLDPETRLRAGVHARRLAEAHPAEHCYSQIMDVYEEVRGARRAAA
jgi:UDP-glucose:(heptosyl)LPS alpha-1,3-glucosyltransferase